MPDPGDGESCGVSACSAFDLGHPASNEADVRRPFQTISMTITIERAYKIRVYPNAEQRALLDRWFGAARWVWNHALERRSKAYRRRGESLSGAVDVSRALTALKKTTRYGWLREIPVTVLTQKLRDQDAAFKNFFEGRAKYPRFRKRGHAESVRLQLDQRQQARAARWNAQLIDVPGLGRLRYRGKHHPAQMPKMVTVRRDAAGRYFASFMLRVEPERVKPARRHALGIDLGLSRLATFSDGTWVENPRHLRAASRRLRRAQRALSRKAKGSGRWRRQRQKVARLHSRVKDTRADTLHKLTRRLVDENQVLCVESLCVKGLARSALAGSVHDAAWGELLRQLAYKARWAGRQLVAIDRWEPTTRRCAACGHIGETLSLSVRRWTCERCGTDHDRDVNAAINICEAGLSLLPRGTGEVMRVEDGRPCGSPGQLGDTAASDEARTVAADRNRPERAAG